jgi:hypothetical protein
MTKTLKDKGKMTANPAPSRDFYLVCAKPPSAASLKKIKLNKELLNGHHFWDFQT